MLKITKTVERLSPSAFIKSMTCPYQYYFDKLTNIGWKREETSLAAGTGTAFDVFVKKKLIELGVESSLPLEKIEASMDCKDPKAEILGQTIFDAYLKAGFIRDTKWVSLEKHSTTKYKGCILSGQLDATVDIDGVESVLDFKVSGAASKTGISPKPGYKNIYTTDIYFTDETPKRLNPGWDKPHKKYREDIPFDEIDLTWAIQFCFYSWLLDPETAGEKDYRVVVHSPIFAGKYKVLKFVVYEGVITKDFQRKLLNNIDKFIEKINSGYWDSPIKNKHVLKHGDKLLSREIAYMLALGESWMTKVELD